MRAIGLLLLWFGLCGVPLAFAFPVTVSDGGTDSVVNMDALGMRAMLSNSAGFAAIVGAILACLTPADPESQLGASVDDADTTEDAARDVPSGVPAE